MCTYDGSANVKWKIKQDDRSNDECHDAIQHDQDLETISEDVSKKQLLCLWFWV